MIATIIINTISIYIASLILKGVKLKGVISAIIVALLLAVVNAFIRPIFDFFLFPLTILTFGLFSFVINAIMLKIVDVFVVGFKIDGFGWAIIMGIIISLINAILYAIL